MTEYRAEIETATVVVSRNPEGATIAYIEVELPEGEIYHHERMFVGEELSLAGKICMSVIVRGDIDFKHWVYMGARAGSLAHEAEELQRELVEYAKEHEMEAKWHF